MLRERGNDEYPSYRRPDRHDLTADIAPGANVPTPIPRSRRMLAASPDMGEVTDGDNRPSLIAPKAAVRVESGIGA